MSVAKNDSDVPGGFDEGEMTLQQQWLEDSASRIFPRPCAIAVQRFDRDDIPLPSPADVALVNAVEKRRREFSAGRVAADTALKTLGIAESRIPVGPARNPVWPAGITGSIAHSSGFAIAAVARQTEIAALGLDLEPIDALGSDLWPNILTEMESRRISEKSRDRQVPMATVIFCIKESFYKLQYPLTGRWVDFSDVDVGFEPEAGTISLVCREPGVAAALRRSRFNGRYALGTRFCLTGMHLSQSEMTTPSGDNP